MIDPAQCTCIKCFMFEERRVAKTENRQLSHTTQPLQIAATKKTSETQSMLKRHQVG